MVWVQTGAWASEVSTVISTAIGDSKLHSSDFALWGAKVQTVVEKVGNALSHIVLPSLRSDGYTHEGPQSLLHSSCNTTSLAGTVLNASSHTPLPANLPFARERGLAVGRGP